MHTSGSLLWILWMASASCSAETLVIGLYDYSELSAKQTVRLTETTGLAFAHSGIQVVWLHCRGALAKDSATACETGMRANEIMVRLEPGGSRSSNHNQAIPLGYAIVTVEGGNYASVFVPAVREQAAGFGLAFDRFLGYAVAHEAGHCLLGPSHSYAGLMRAAWDRKDAGQMSRLSLNLTKQEARKAGVRLALAARK
jgi:hypothetical protein